jgi:ABC-type Na+ efflux pump permease subunit
MRPFVAIVKKELRSIVQERTIMIAVVIQLFIASFASVLVVGLVSFYDPGSIAENARIGIRAGVVGDRRGVLAAYLAESKVDVRRYSSAEEARDAVRRRIIHAALIMPNSDPVHGRGVVQGRLLLPQSESLSTVVLMVLRPPLEDYENHLREERGIQVRYADVEGRPSTTYEFRYTVIVPILMLFPAFVSGSMVVDSISEEFENRTMETLRAAPVSAHAIVAAKIAAGLVLAVVQSLMWLLLLRANGTRLDRPVLIWSLAGILGATVSTGSALIAVAFRERERAQFVYSITIPLLAGASYLLGISPTTLIARLATGHAYTGIADVGIYTIPLLALLAALLLGLRRGLRI